MKTLVFVQVGGIWGMIPLEVVISVKVDFLREARRGGIRIGRRVWASSALNAFHPISHCPLHPSHPPPP